MTKKWDKMKIIAGILAYNGQYPVCGRDLVGITVIGAKKYGASMTGAGR